MGNEIEVFQPDAETQIVTRFDGETFWLTQKEIAAMFEVDRSVVTKHLKNAQDEELCGISVCAKFAHTAADGKIYQVVFYNLDVVISVGYRVKSLEGVRFRQWATRILREMLLNRIVDMRRVDRLESRMDKAETAIQRIEGGVNYLVRQLSEPPNPPKRGKIGFHP